MEFLEARIAEEETALLRAHAQEWTLTPTLALRMLAECAQKREVVECWKRAAASEGVSNLAEVRGTLTMARRTMLMILAAAYRSHPDHSDDWLS